MPSRVVHIRLDDWVILGCHDILKAGSSFIDNIPMATIVRQVLTAPVRRMQNTNQIPSYSKEETLKRAMELYSGALELDFDIQLEELVAPEDEKTEDMQSIVTEALALINAESEPADIRVDVEVSDVDEEIEIEETTNLLQIQSDLTFDEVKELSPKDRYVESAIKEDSEVVKKAVAIIYSGLPRALWGSEKAGEMVVDLLKKHRE